MLTVIVLGFAGFYFMFMSRFTNANTVLNRILFNVIPELLAIFLILYAAYLLRLL